MALPKSARRTHSKADGANAFHGPADRRASGLGMSPRPYPIITLETAKHTAGYDGEFVSDSAHLSVTLSVVTPYVPTLLPTVGPVDDPLPDDS